MDFRLLTPPRGSLRVPWMPARAVLGLVFVICLTGVAGARPGLEPLQDEPAAPETGEAEAETLADGELQETDAWEPTSPALPLERVGAQAPPGPRMGANAVHYDIQATLDGPEKVLSGTLRVRWTNASADAVSDLWFHLYWNAFANNRSTHLVESGGTARGRPFKESWGWQRVTAVSLHTFESSGKVDLLPSFRYRMPDDENEDDRTVFSVELPRPVLPGQTIEVGLEWTAQIPRVRRRTGYKDDFLLIAQWFPKLGVYESGRGWNCHEFHSAAEFFSDYGTYKVRLDLPAAYEGKVFGSGGRPSTVVKGGRVVVTFEAPTRDDQRRVDHTARTPAVHDFAWAADPRYEVHTFTFRPAEWLTDKRYAEEVATVRRAFGEDADLGLRDVDVTVLVQPEHAQQAKRHFDATATALFFYGLWFGGYPYEHITVVDPRYGARGAGGMEYPTLFTAGTRLYTTPDMHSPEGVTVHEAGHQFWYGLVGNNEPEASWMDEGFNSYTDNEALVRRYGPQRGTTSYVGLPAHGVRAARLPGGDTASKLMAGQELRLPWVGRVPYIKRFARVRPLRPLGFVQWWRDQPALTLVSRWSDPRWGNRSGYLRHSWSDAIDNRVWEYAPGAHGTNSYARPAAVLSTLEGLVGREAFLRGMRHYADTWRYQHPYPDDFFESFQEGDGLDDDLGWFFEEFFRGTGTADWSVRVSQKQEAKREGWFQAGPQAEFLELGADEEAESDGEVDAETSADVPESEAGAGGAGAEQEDEGQDEKEKDEQPHEIQITLKLQGTLALPLPYRLTWDDGTVEDMLWTREQQHERRWLRIRRLSTRKLVSVELDPDRNYQIDQDMSNNQWFDDTDDVAPLRWSERVFSQSIQLLHWQSRIGG